MAEACEIIITSLPSPAASAAVIEADDGVLAGLSAGKIWVEMSITDAAEVERLGTASVLKMMTNYLATANLISLSEALVTSKMAWMDLNTTYEAIRILSGNSFVYETESQVILNGSRDINFTMGLVLKDIGLLQSIAEQRNVPLEF